ncbi:MAG: ornithine carbamoyltransferase [Lachnospiraceae bacterium]|nr:ornithine carbamoyltransferase [Lachnospiraceae bacterium]
MSVNLKGRSFLTLRDYTAGEIQYLLDLAIELKDKKKKGIYEYRLKNKNIALIFEKPSTRTRSAFTVGCTDEGAHPEYLGRNDIQLGHKETVADTARVLGRIFDGIEFRGFSQKTVEDLAKYSGVPVWNGLTDEDHPTQVLADFMTMQEKFGEIKGLNFTYFGDGRNNMANALMIGCAKMGVNFTVAAPKSLWTEKELLATCMEYASVSGSSINFTENPLEGAKGADVIYTDVWVSMGEEEKAAERLEILKPYQVNSEIMAETGKKNSIFMHCLPAVRDYEVTEEVLEGPYSVVFDEAENRMHTIKAVMVATLGN